MKRVLFFGFVFFVFLNLFLFCLPSLNKASALNCSGTIIIPTRFDASATNQNSSVDATNACKNAVSLQAQARPNCSGINSFADANDPQQTPITLKWYVDCFGFADCSTNHNWTCPATACVNTTYYYGTVSCSTTNNMCDYTNSHTYTTNPTAATGLIASYTNPNVTFTWTNGNGTSRILYYCDQTLAGNTTGSNGQPIQCTRDAHPSNETAASAAIHAGWYFLATDTTSPVGPTNAPNAGLPLTQGHTYSWFVREVNCYGNTDADSVFSANNTNNLTGQVYIDYNGNGLKDGADIGKAGVTVSDGVSPSVTTDANGDYLISNVTPGTHTVSISNYGTGNITYPVPYPPSVLTNTTQNFAVEPLANVSGQVYVDADKNGQINSGDYAYASSGLAVTICQGNQPGGCTSPLETLTTNTTNGIFTTTGVTQLPYGDYTAILTIPSGYQASLPKPPVAVFTVGPSCQATAPANCDVNGNVQNLNFGILNSFPWMQTTGGDIIDNGFTDNIPTTADLTCSGGAYASAIGPGGTPGIVNTGSGDANFGEGQASAQNWLVGGLGSGSYPYLYNMPLSRETRTSYTNLNYLVHQSNIQTRSLSAYCGGGGLSSCTLPANIAGLPSGVYVVDNNLTLNSPTGTGGSYTFPSSGSYVILIHGILTINTKIIVPNGSFVFFSASDDINVDSSVGDTAFVITSNLEGYYSTDKSFNALGKGTNGAAVDCSSGNKDLRLNVAGSIVVNADTANGGGLNYNRDMCADNLACPVLSITERPDFVLNTPTFLMFPRRVWQEVAP